jgi:hypothetical protein
MTTTTHKIAVCLIGGRTAVIEIGGLRWLTDPTVHAPGRIASGTRRLTTTQPPAVQVEDTGVTDAVPLSRDEHGDDLDHGGREPARVRPVPTTGEHALCPAEAATV